MTLTRLPDFDATSFDATARVAAVILAQTGEQLVAIDRDGLGVLAPAADSRPLSKTLPLQGPGSEAEQFKEALRQADSRGLTVVAFDSTTRAVTYARLLPAVRQIRDAIAGALSSTKKVEPWQVDVAVTWSTAVRIDFIEVRAREVSLDPAKAHAIWRQVALRLPGGSNGWTVAQDLTGGTVALTWGAPPSLPERVPLDAVLPAVIDPDDWANSAFGIDSTGAIASHRLSGGPHVLLGGPTDSGKTAAITTMLASRLMRGHDVIIIDPVKGVDFETFRPFSLAIAETYEESVGAMDWLIEEAQRRKAVLKAHRAVKWLDLPPEVREAEGIKPLTVVIDELGQLFMAIKENQALDKDHPVRVRQRIEGGAKALIDAGTGEIGRAYRFVGLFLLLATQKTLVQFLGANGSELRSNCSNAAYLHPPQAHPDRGNLTLLFDQLTDAAVESLETLNDGSSRGLCVTVTESGQLAAVRVAYAPPAAVEQLLLDRGVPQPTPLSLGEAAQAAPAPAAPVWR